MKENPKRKLGFDPAHPAINKIMFHQCDWTDFYRDTGEAIPGNVPVARGNFMLAHSFIDTNHAGDTEMTRSQTGILLFCNTVPIIWFIKMSNSVEVSTFG